jgi:hypothetical protein
MPSLSHAGPSGPTLRALDTARRRGPGICSTGFRRPSDVANSAERLVPRHSRRAESSETARFCIWHAKCSTIVPMLVETKPACPKPNTAPPPAPTQIETAELVVRPGWDPRRKSGQIEAAHILGSYSHVIPKSDDR